MTVKKQNKKNDGIYTNDLDIVLYAKYVDETCKDILLTDEMTIFLKKIEDGSTIWDASKAAGVTIARVALWRVTNRLFDLCITLQSSIAVDALESDVISSRSKTSDRLATLALQGNRAKYNAGMVGNDKPNINVTITLSDTTAGQVQAHDITPKITDGNDDNDGT